MPLETLYDLVTIKCFDEDVMMDDFVGEATLMANKLCNPDSMMEAKLDWHEL